MKTKTFLLILVIALGVGNAFGNDYPSGSLLWKVSGKDLEKPSYIVGTFHLKNGDFLDSIPGANTALDLCEQVIGELDMTDMLKVQRQLMPAMLMTSDTTYNMLYTEDEYNLVNEKLISLMEIGLDQMGVLKPSALQTTIAMMMYQKILPDFNAENPLDVAIQKIGQQKGKLILGIETVEDQIRALFGTSSLKRQATLLLCTLQYIDEIGEQAAIKLLENYDNRDLNALYFESYLDDVIPCQSTKEEQNALLKDRNDKWMEKLPELMKDKSSFIAVGALHLAGEEGLLHQLMQLGYDVEAIQ